MNERNIDLGPTFLFYFFLTCLNIHELQSLQEKFPLVEAWREGVIPASDSQTAPVSVAPSGHVTVGMHTHVSRCLCKCLRGDGV